MAPTLARSPFSRDGWLYEEKVDGWRMLAYKDGARVRLISRNAVDHTARFRELARRDLGPTPPAAFIVLRGSR
jgi:bifunctional non-homologous end joining protein LigD